MESVNRQTMEPMLGGAFDNGAYGVTSADLDPLDVDHVAYSLSPVTSYVPAGLQPWNPYLGSVSLQGTTTEQNFDPSYTLGVSATPEHAVGPSAAEFQPVFEWSVDLQSYQHQTRTDLDYGHGYQATVGPIYTDFRPGYVVQQPDSDDTQPYRHQQLSSVQQYNYQDAVSSVAPTPVSHHSPSRLQQCELPGMTKEQLAEQDNALHQQSAAHLQKLYRAGSISGTKRTKTDDRSPPQLPQHVSKRRGRRRKSQPAPHEPVPARIDVWTRPTPVAFNTYHSSSSQGESASSSSPTLYKKASLLSIADGSNSSRLESYDGHRPQGRFETNSGDNSDRMEYVLSPVQTISGSLGLSPSPGVTTSSTAFSTPATSIHPASSASSAVSNLKSNQLQPTSTTATKQPQTTARSFPSTSQAEPPNSKPAPGPAGRTNAPHSDLDPKGKARRYSSAVSHGPDHDHDHDPDPPPKPRRVSGSAADQKARNRVAATKCRLKTKAAISRLEVEERAASEQNAALATAVAQLRQESYLLRSQLLLHAGCDCRLIQQYLAAQAKKLAEAGRGEGTARGAEGGSENEMVTGSRDVGQRGQRRWNDHDKGAVVFESDDNYDNDDDDDGDDENWES